jgi:hypothetical protein
MLYCSTFQRVRIFSPVCFFSSKLEAFPILHHECKEMIVNTTVDLQARLDYGDQTLKSLAL